MLVAAVAATSHATFAQSMNDYGAILSTCHMSMLGRLSGMVHWLSTYNNCQSALLLGKSFI
jgi:hypothetical protein